ncbi:protein PF3D7_1417600-like [Battus philenor]|uniref:protein PF3D7_1417600-like n=1 Tax=Battus philenor TaxID=42288 RepID=UPI0035CEA17B
MLISHLTEDNSDEALKQEIEGENENNRSISQSDLVTLYENVDTRPTFITLKNLRSANQHVETVVYNDEQESDDSDVSDMYCNEDLRDIILINKERIDLINSVPSLDKTLCPKFGDIQSNGLTNSNDNFLLKNHFVKEQFGTFSNISTFGTFDGTFLPMTLLNFVYCNQMDDASNLYMDNIIQYAKRTIDQLKRISNGDYLTDKVKEKWRTSGDAGRENKLAMIVSSRSNTCEDRINEFNNNWNNIAHPELNIESLSRIIEKGVIVKIPRFIYDSFTFNDKRNENKFVITCKGETQRVSEEEEDSKIDIVLELKPARKNFEDSINSVLILQRALPHTRNESILPIEYNQFTSTTNIGINYNNKITITELDENDLNENEQNLNNDVENFSKLTSRSDSTDTANTISSGLCISEISSQFTFNTNDLTSPSDKQVNVSEQINTETQISCYLSPPDDLFCSIQKLNTQTVLLEETEEMPLVKKKSSTKVRIKSPYENKSHIIEEMKRRKLLEIRERRERRKKIHSENCKVTKYKHGKSAVMAQSTNSVTKLSISNKSFYASIYGDSTNLINKHPKKHYSESSEVILIGRESDPIADASAMGSRNQLNSSFYMDDPETEVMNLRIKNDYQKPETENSSTPASSEIVNDIAMNFDSFVRFASYNSSATDLKPKNASCDTDKHELTSSDRLHTTTPESTSTSLVNNANNSNKKSQMSLECKKSIDKIYELMKRLSKVDSSDSWYSRHPESSTNTSRRLSCNKNIALPTTDSGTSLKHQLTSSNPSVCSFEETNEVTIPPNKVNKKAGVDTNVVSKVIISSKTQNKDSEFRPNKKVTINAPENNAKNPLKAIAHLINEFDHIQKSRQKTTIEAKEQKKINKVMDGKNFPRNSFLKKAVRLDEQIKDTNTNPNKIISPNRKIQPKTSIVRGKVMNPQLPNANRNVERDKKMIDIVDEALREARGEAVRGPPRPYTRIDSLAQPKRINVTGQNERLKQRKSIIPSAASQVSDKVINSASASSKIKQKRIDQEQISTPTAKVPSNSSPTEKPNRLKRMTNTVSVDNVTPPVIAPPYKPKTIAEISLPSTSSIINEQIENKIRNISDSSSKNLPIIKESKTSECCNVTNMSIATDDLKDDELVSTCSDYVFDILEDKDVLTAVSDILPKNSKGKDDEVEELENDNRITTVDSNINLTQYNEVIEGIETLEKALYSQISHGSFQKRLKIKNFTLTPKQSINPVFLLQSGDANSLLVKSCMSQSLHVNSPKVVSEAMHVPVPLFSGSFADQTLTKLPINITTVGYVFSKLKPIEHSCNTPNKCMGIQTPIFQSNVQLTSEENCNDEKGVQTFTYDDGSYCHNIDAMKETKFYKGTNLQETFVDLNKVKEDEDEKAITRCETINNTTSLDILVELLDEIEKITKYQDPNAKDKNNSDSTRSLEFFTKQTEHMALKFSGDLAEGNIKKNINVLSENSFNLDKATYANITKELVNGCTDVPSQLCILEDPYKNLTSSLKKVLGHPIDDLVSEYQKEISQYCMPKDLNDMAPKTFTGIVSQSSSHSLISLYDYRTYYCNKFREVPYDTDTFNPCHGSGKQYNIPKKHTSKDVQKYEEVNMTKYGRKNNGIAYYVDQKESDAMLKMKRDVLVTVYSILVFTVFAALSFPEFLYRS